MRILVVGAGRIGARVIRQLKKNAGLTLLTVDPREIPFAVKEGIIPSVTYNAKLTPIELEQIIEKCKPDLVLVTTSSEDIGRSGVPGIEILVESLRGELEATSKVPIIAVDRSSIH